ncbi:MULTISPECIES: trans-aconitate 2-methyltransferase [unclassified Streptomyces]|uniref:class I SAM-dependent methyltransferase n=1 Tax=unclassified Streptomyces TaxID=2593676 RepID=UPI00168C002D|nr:MULTISPECIES: class I SAM-dependent methyltransferase [unclassified Streptomyces]MBD3003744.1 class I SAM-dependent methyltransferase [Streptomyces sp. 5-10]
MNRTDHAEAAADLAAIAALLEISEELGLSALLDRAAPFTLDDVAQAADVADAGATGILEALLSAGLVQPGEDARHFVPCSDLADRRYEAGYLSWALSANRPYIDHAAEFLRDPGAAGALYQRDGRRVALSSRWVGSFGFYPGVVSEITGRKPERIVDLGAGAGGLLIHLLATLPGSTGLALDLNPAACQEAERAARRAEVAERLQVVNRSIESLVDDPSPLRGADVVHAGFVLHDVVSRPDVLDGVLRACRTSIADGGCLIVTDAVPYAAGDRERAFSALFTYLHSSSMGVRLPDEEEWQSAFRRAGYSEVSATPLPMPGSRVFVAAK